MFHHNLNTHNVVFCVFLCRTLNDFNMLPVIIVMCHKNKQMDYRSNIMSNDMRTLPSFFSNTGKTEKFDPIKTF